MSESPNPEVAILNAALELPAGQRAAYLDQACAGNTALRQQVEVLIQAHEQAGRFLELPPTGVDFHRTALTPLPIAEKPGDTVGRYKLLQQIGEGGCGVVYMAEQEQPVRRRVALKILKLGMDTKQVIARFEAERQALALMDHPNIAKVLDAGATETGRPYFVMELVRGIKITEFCDQNNIATEERLKLFIQVCQAIQHAHQKGIIHRDIKPSNILVTVSEPGSPGVPKVIDFGIAKATQGRLTDQTLFTAFEQFLGTPAYMSPEQAVMTSLDIDTRSDIYSLGVLLYELLTGKTPFEQKELLAAGLDEMRRTILEKEPPKPSTRLTQELASNSSRQQLELVRLVRGDLDWIVMKCLEKDRARRYSTANGLAADIQRHLSDEPVVARPPSKLYEFRKTVRRHKFGFAAGAAIGVVLLAGAIVSTWQAVRATTERRRADEQAATANRITESLQQMLASANPNTAKGGDYSVRQMLDDYADKLGESLVNEPVVEATLQDTIGNAYWRLGDGDKGVKHLERALQLRDHVFGRQNKIYADTLVDYGWALWQQNNYTNAEARVRGALVIYRQCGVSGRPVIRALQTLQVILHSDGRLDEIEPIVNQALVEARKTPTVEYPEIASIYHGLITAEIHNNDFARAVDLARTSLAMHLRLDGPDHPETGWGYGNLGFALTQAHTNYNEALAAEQKGLAIFRKEFPPGHPTIGYALGQLRDTLLTAADASELSELFSSPKGLEEVESIFHEIAATKPAGTNSATDPALVARNAMAQFPELYIRFSFELSASNRTAEAEELQKQADLLLQELQSEFGRDTLMPPAAVRNLAASIHARGRDPDVEKLYEQLIPLECQALGVSNATVGELYFDYAEFLRGERKWDACVEEYIKSLPGLRSAPSDKLATSLRNVGAVVLNRGGPKVAEPYLRETLDVYHHLHPGKEDQWASAWPAANLGRALYEQNQITESIEAYHNATTNFSRCLAIRKANVLGSDNAPLNEFAWFLATFPDERFRDGMSAVSFAEKAVAATNHKNPAYLDTLAAAYAEAGQFTNAVATQREAITLLNSEEDKNAYGVRLRLYESLSPCRDPDALTTQVKALLNNHQFVMAEPLARECLAVHERLVPDDWRTCNVRSLLGATLLGQKKYAEAEPLLLSGFQGLKQRENTIPTRNKVCLAQAIQRLTQLYEETNRPDQAAEWKQQLAGLDKQGK
jgi:serine/threonine protein kinase/tetratricopeptide (TPR) repeat protein